RARAAAWRSAYTCSTLPRQAGIPSPPPAAGFEDRGAYSVRAACEEAIVARGRAARPAHTAHRVERLGARIHLLIGHGPILRCAFGQVAPTTTGEIPHAVAGVH